MPNLIITYCTGCNWLLRAGWYAQECLSTFGTAISVTLIPDDSGGIFQISLDGATIWDRKRDGGFPDIKTLKQRVRDVIDPERSLGHSDK